MSLSLSQMKQELKELREKKQLLDNKIQALENMVEVWRSEHNPTAGKTARGIDIRPAIRTFFEKNSNAPAQLREIVTAVEEAMSELNNGDIRRKMIYLTREGERQFLEKEEYGKYRLKEGIQAA